MKEYVEYYLKDTRLSDLFKNGSNRVKKYLQFIFERSYLLFVLHNNNMRGRFWKDCKRAKVALTKEDLNYLTKYASEIYSREDVINGILYGIGERESDTDTVEVILREWRIEEDVHYFSGNDVPLILLEWLNFVRGDFRNIQQMEGDYYLKNVCITFLFNDVWYSVFPSDLGLNDFTFEKYSDEIMLSLDSYGARNIRYSGMMD